MPEYMRYGTAGFRTTAVKMHTVSLKMGIVASLYARYHHPKAVGVCFTASHNPAEDNGVKMVDSDGHMADEQWEKIAEDIVNDEYAGVHDTDGKKGIIVIGRDTRESGPALIEQFKRGLLDDVEIIDAGLVTTPQLHYIVKCINQGVTLNEALQMYYQSFASTYNRLASKLTNQKKSLHNGISVCLDCANGVGTAAMRALIDLLDSNFELINSGQGILNYQCGADHVKMTKSPPLNAQKSNCIGASFDGDADRLIMWYFDVNGEFRVIDGDKQLALICYFLSQQGLRVAAVQTAYANGASTRYLHEHGIPVHISLTGVKHLHATANQLAGQFDAVVYFESNGHGTVLFSDCIQDKTVKLIKELVNEVVGDAISDLLLVLSIMTLTGMTVSDIGNLYEDLPSIQVKMHVKDKRAYETAIEVESKLIRPQQLQSAIDKLIDTVEQGRAFVRPSGTENVLRVYSEGLNLSDAQQLAAKIITLIENAEKDDI